MSPMLQQALEQTLVELQLALERTNCLMLRRQMYVARLRPALAS